MWYNSKCNPSIYGHMQPTLTSSVAPTNHRTGQFNATTESGMTPSSNTPRIQVIRRDGSWAPLNIGKIRAV
ncbi:MAG: hypothetical protein ACKO2V_10340, partial [Snowella sp.]